MSKQTTCIARPLDRHFFVAPIALVLALVALLVPVAALAQTPVTTGYRDLSYGTTATTTPTGEKPESKLWWNDGFWWGSLCSSTDSSYHIFRLDLATQIWVDTGTQLDQRPSSKADTLWDGQKLYVDGSLVASASYLAPGAGSGYWRFGGDTWFAAWPADYFSGDLDEVAVYPTILNAQQVAWHYHANH
jgi:hypothetical protein